MKDPKIAIEIINHPQAILKKYPIKNGHVIIKAGGKGAKDLKWEPNYDSSRTIKFKPRFGPKYEKAYYIANSKDLMPLTPNGQPPDFTAEPILRAASEKLLEKQAKTNTVTTAIEYILLLLLIIVVGCQLAIMANLGIIDLGVILARGIFHA